MSKFIIISKHALAKVDKPHSDFIINLEMISFMGSVTHEGYPSIEIQLLEKLAWIHFNNPKARDHYFEFMLQQCGAVHAPSISENIK